MVGGGMREVDPGKVKDAAYSHLLKVCLCGDATGGKTAALTKFTQDTFDPAYLITIGIDFAVKTVEIDGGDLVKLQLWDTAGQERFRTITNSYYRGSHGIIIFFALNDRDSFDKVPNWINEVKNYTRGDTTIVLAGTKSDLEEERVITSDEFNDLARQEELPHIEISALTGDNVFRLFEIIVGLIIKTKTELRNEAKSGSTLLGKLTGNSSSNKPLKKSQSDGANNKSKTCSIL